MNVCQSCETPLTPDEWLTGACPFCGAEIEDRSALRRPGKISALFHGDAVTSDAADRPGWATVRAALGLYILGVTALWTGAAVNAASRLVLRSLETQAPLFITLRWASLPVGLFGAFALVAGYLLCTAVPMVSGSRRWIQASVVLSLLAAGLLFFQQYMELSNGEAETSRAALTQFLGTIAADNPDVLDVVTPAENPWSEWTVRGMGIACLVAVIAACTLHVVFLALVARYLKRKSLSVMILLLYGGLLLLFGMAALFVIFSPDQAPELGRDGALEYPTRQLGGIFFLLAFVLLTGFIGCFVVMRGCIARIVRGEYLTASEKIPTVMSHG